MGRSVKKGPYVQPVLLKRVQEMNNSGEKRVLPYSLILSAIPSRYTTDASMFRYM